MIIRAVSDDEGDDERGSVFGSSSGSHPTFASASSGRGAVARRLWVAVCAAVVGLLLADVAALAGLLTRAPSLPGVADEFALVPLSLSLAFPVPGSVSAVRAAPASALNHWVGLALVAAWVYSREAAAAAPTRRCWLWVGAIASFGHATSCVYVLAALLESNGDRAMFWAGASKRRPVFP
jgi:hypothetical protein